MHGKCQCQTGYGFGILIGKRKERGESRISTGRREKTEKKFFALILSIFTVAGILFCVQQMFVDTKWWFNFDGCVRSLLSGYIFHKKHKIVLVYFVLGILLLFVFRTIWISGALDFVNQVTAGFNAVTGESVFYFVVPNYMNRELATVVFFCLTAWFLSWIFDNCNQRKTLGSCPCFLGSACIFGCIF